MSYFNDNMDHAVNYQAAGSELLARNVASALNESRWINNDLKIRFCILFMRSILDHKTHDPGRISLIQKINRKPLRFAIRLLKRYPEEGLSILSQSIMVELQSNQNFKLDQLVSFHTVLLNLLFPNDNLLSGS